MERAAFAPKERFSEPDSLGTVFVSDDTEVNVREAVASSDDYGPQGFIVTDDQSVIAKLDQYEQLKRVTLSETERQPKRQRGSVASGGLSGSTTSTTDEEE